jgi:hypothetical protein
MASTGSRTTPEYRATPEASGWTVFASILLVMVAALDGLWGLAARPASAAPSAGRTAWSVPAVPSEPTDDPVNSTASLPWRSGQRREPT